MSCFIVFFLTSARQEVRVPVQPAHYGPRRLGVGGTASCSFLQRRELGTTQCASDVRRPEQRGSKCAFAKPRSRNPTCGAAAANPAWPRRAGRQERAGLGGAQVE